MQGARPGQVVSQQGALPRQDRIWAGVIWLRVVFGLVLAGGGGVAIGHAWTSESTPWWAVGGTTLMVGILMALSGVYARSHPRGIVPQVVITQEPAETREPSMPLLGALLVYKYQVITHRQLRQALEEQKKTTPRRRLGEILVLKGLITVRELEEALSFQQSAASDESAGQDEQPGTRQDAEEPAGLLAPRPTKQ